VVNRLLALRRNVSATLLFALAGALLQAACSTTYQPRRTGRVGVVIHRGAVTYEKDGRELPVGPFTGDLEGLVQDRPAAAVHARTAHTQFIIGVPAYVAGLAGVIVGIAALSGPIGWVVIGLGASTAGTGLGLMGAGVTHAVDAVNIHNDAASQIDPAPARGTGPPLP
jgi:hypothetical protein